MDRRKRYYVSATSFSISPNGAASFAVSGLLGPPVCVASATTTDINGIGTSHPWLQEFRMSARERAADDVETISRRIRELASERTQEHQNRNADSTIQLSVKFVGSDDSTSISFTPTIQRLLFDIYGAEWAKHVFIRRAEGSR